jgi:hypothetical protein
MTSRFYLSSSGAVNVTPSSWSSGWTVAAGTSLPLSKPKRDLSSALVIAGSGISGQKKSGARFVSTPLRAQTISGTVKGQIRCREANAADNYSLAFAIKIVKPDGTDRAVLLPVQADGSAPAEFSAVATNRKFRDSSGNSSIALTEQIARDGDMLVVELGILNQSASVADATLDLISDQTDDLPEDDATILDSLNAWVEFSANIQLQPANWTPEIAALEKALGQGASSVTFADGGSITYRSVEELERALDRKKAEAAAAANETSTRRRFASYSKD